MIRAARNDRMALVQHTVQYKFAYQACLFYAARFSKADGSFFAADEPDMQGQQITVKDGGGRSGGSEGGGVSSAPSSGGGGGSNVGATPTAAVVKPTTTERRATDGTRTGTSNGSSNPAAPPPPKPVRSSKQHALRTPADTRGAAPPPPTKKKQATDRPQRYFRIPFVKQGGVSDESLLSSRARRGWWYAHFDGRWIARQMELQPETAPVLLSAGVDDTEMCELSLEETGLTRKRGAEVLPREFEAEWSKHGGDPSVPARSNVQRKPSVKSNMKKHVLKAIGGNALQKELEQETMPVPKRDETTGEEKLAALQGLWKMGSMSCMTQDNQDEMHERLDGWTIEIVDKVCVQKNPDGDEQIRATINVNETNLEINEYVITNLSAQKVTWKNITEFDNTTLEHTWERDVSFDENQTAEELVGTVLRMESGGASSQSMYDREAEDAQNILDGLTLQQGSSTRVVLSRTESVKRSKKMRQSMKPSMKPAMRKVVETATDVKTTAYGWRLAATRKRKLNTDVGNDNVLAIKRQKALRKKYNLETWKYSYLRDTLNTSDNIDLLEICREEFCRRLKVYHAWKMQNVTHMYETATLRGAAPASPKKKRAVDFNRPQRFFRTPFSKPGEQGAKKGLWYAHFDGQIVARQMETHPEHAPVLLVAGRDNALMCDLSLEETRLLQQKSREILPRDFDAEWLKLGGDPYTTPSSKRSPTHSNNEGIEEPPSRTFSEDVRANSAAAGKSWFWGNISKDEANAALAGENVGTFLVRTSASESKTYTLSMMGLDNKDGDQTSPDLCGAHCVHCGQVLARAEAFCGQGQWGRSGQGFDTTCKIYRGIVPADSIVRFGNVEVKELSSGKYDVVTGLKCAQCQHHVHGCLYLRAHDQAKAENVKKEGQYWISKTSLGGSPKIMHVRVQHTVDGYSLGQNGTPYPTLEILINCTMVANSVSVFHSHSVLSLLPLAKGLDCCIDYYAKYSAMSLEGLVSELKLANATKSWNPKDPKIEAICCAYCDALPGGPRAWLSKIDAAVSHARPMWNCNDSEGCAAIYKAVATVFSGRHVALYRALSDSQGISFDSFGYSEGNQRILLRSALDHMLDTYSADDEFDVHAHAFVVEGSGVKDVNGLFTVTNLPQKPGVLAFSKVGADNLLMMRWARHDWFIFDGGTDRTKFPGSEDTIVYFKVESSANEPPLDGWEDAGSSGTARGLTLRRPNVYDYVGPNPAEWAKPWAPPAVQEKQPRRRSMVFRPPTVSNAFERGMSSSELTFSEDDRVVQRKGSDNNPYPAALVRVDDMVRIVLFGC